jgi:hypothetical protein
MLRETPERRVPKTTLVPETSPFYGLTDTPQRKPSAKTRPISIPIPPAQVYLGLETRSDNSYPPIQKSSGLTSPIGDLWKPYAINKDLKDRRRTTNSNDDELVSMDIDDMIMISQRRDELDDEDMDEDEPEECIPTPGASFKVSLDGIEEGMWLSGAPAKDNHDREIDMFSESFKQVDEPTPEEEDFEMPPTPRLKNLAPPGLSKPSRGSGETTDPDTMPAFLTPFANRGEIATHPYHRSAEFVLAQTRQREASIVRPAAGSTRPKKRKGKEENFYVTTLQRAFSKAIQQAESPRPRVVTPPAADLSPPEDPWWGDRLSPPGKSASLEKYSEVHHIEVADDDDDDTEMEDRSLWAAQTHGLGLGLGLGFNLELPLMTRTTSSRPVPRPQRGVDENSPSPPLTRTPSGNGLPRSLSAGDLSALSPALPLDGVKQGSMTPSPTTPEIVTPEFENDSAERKVLVKEKYREAPGRSIEPFFGHSWGRRSPPSDEDDDDDDMPLMPRPTKKDKGKGKAVVADEGQDDPSQVPSLIPDTGNPDGVDYEALAEAFGLDDVEEVMMHYALERSRQEATMRLQKEVCGDSPGASTSRSPPSPTFATDVEMEDAATPTVPPGRQSNSSPNPDLEDEEADWFKGWTFPTVQPKSVSLSAELQRSLSTHLNTPDDQDQAEDQVGPTRIGSKRKAI